MKVLFIGGTGTISSACSAKLVEDGHDLHIVTRGTRDHRVPLGATVIHGDIDHDKTLLENLKRRSWDVVVDFIAYESWQVERDLGLTFNQYIFISSGAVYGIPTELPITEKIRLGDTGWSYAINKRACERILRDSERPWTIIRPGHIYAPFALPSAIRGVGFKIFDSMLTDNPIVLHDNGRTLWSLMLNSDFAVAFSRLIGLSDAINEDYNIASDESLSWLKIYGFMAEALGISHPRFKFLSTEMIKDIDPLLWITLAYDKSYDHVWDTSKIRRIAGDFQCKKFSEGVKLCVDYYRRANESQGAVDRYSKAI